MLRLTPGYYASVGHGFEALRLTPDIIVTITSEQLPMPFSKRSAIRGPAGGFRHGSHSPDPSRSANSKQGIVAVETRRTDPHDTNTPPPLSPRSTSTAPLPQIVHGM